MKFSYACYQLKLRSGGIRIGAILRIPFADGSYGHADCHPWVEFGDLILEEQLNALKRDQLTLLLQRSLHYAKLEAKARKKGVSLFKDLSLPKSHLQINLGDSSSYPLLKLKLKPHQVEQFFDWADNRVLWRLDFNSSFTSEECEQFLKKAKHFNIDFIEDPFPYNASEWHRQQKQYDVAFAEDFEEGSEAQVIICKPAVREILQTKKRRIVTTYIDHPIGQLSALYTAAIDPDLQKEPGGFFTHTLYEPNAFIDRLKIDQDRLLPPIGIGWGYDQELEQLEWR
ncbi:MAG: hypothetical protein ACK5MA_06015 [Parachlamydiaceae bacterium]